MDLKETELVNPEVHWYYQSKLAFLIRALRPFTSKPGTVVDVGAGSGFFSQSLMDAAMAHEAVCIDPNYSEEHLGQEGAVLRVRTASTSTVQSADVFLFIDVLEHVASDLDLLREYVSEAKPGAVFAISVPAFQSLWSQHDVFLEHFRRYRLNEVEKVATESGLSVQDAHYLFSGLFPAVYVFRKLKRPQEEAKSDMSQPSPTINKVLRSLCSFDPLLPTRKHFGLSAFVIAVKPEPPTTY